MSWRKGSPCFFHSSTSCWLWNVPLYVEDVSEGDEEFGSFFGIVVVCVKFDHNIDGLEDAFIVDSDLPMYIEVFSD